MSVHQRRLLALAGALTAACSAGVRLVPGGPHVPALANPVVVEYPPPPAKPELVTADPGAPCQWLDGHWTWAGRRWHWISGAWVVPPPSCYYARSVLAWYSPPGASEAPPAGKTQSRLYYTEPKWYPRAERGKARVCPEPRPCAAQPAAESEP